MAKRKKTPETQSDPLGGISTAPVTGGRNEVYTVSPVEHGHACGLNVSEDSHILEKGHPVIDAGPGKVLCNDKVVVEVHFPDGRSAKFCPYHYDQLRDVSQVLPTLGEVRRLGTITVRNG